MSKLSYRLMEYHQRLDQELRAELRRNWPNFSRVQRLKKLKLAVKDRLVKLIRGNGGAQTA